MVRKTNKNNNKNKKQQEQARELTRLGNALRVLGGMGGGALGNLIGEGTSGKQYGRTAGASVSKWLGSGDYTVSNNTLLGPNGTIPAMHSAGQSVTIRHKEYVGIIRSSAAFEVQQSFVINPGLSATFPWLSKIATSFQEYRIKGMVFHYIPSSGAAVSSTNPALGTVMFQTTYRSTDDKPANKMEILNEYWASESVPCEPFCHAIECNPRENPFNVQYVRSQDLPTGENQLMYDLGTTYVAVQGMQTTGNPVGDLWVTYDIELKKPIVGSNVSSHIVNYGARFNGAVNSVNLFAQPKVVSPVSSIDVLFDVGNRFYLPKGLQGKFYITLQFANGMTAFSNFTAGITYINCTALAWPDTTVVFSGPLNNTGTDPAQAIVYTAITIDDPTLSAAIDYPTYVWSGTNDFLIIAISQLE